MGPLEPATSSLSGAVDGLASRQGAGGTGRKRLAEQAQKKYAGVARVLYFTGHAKAQLVVVRGGKKQGLLNGSLLKVFRPETAYIPEVQTGLLKILRLGEEQSIARVIHNSTAESRSIFASYPGIMAGDNIRRLRYSIRPKMHSLPRWGRQYRDLFAVPGPQPANYELSDQGKAILAHELNAFRGKHISRLFIKAYTDDEGTVAENQMESYQRALTIRQYMIETLRFRAESLVAIGLGESDLKDKTKAWGADTANRRIEVHAVREPDPSPWNGR